MLLQGRDFRSARPVHEVECRKAARQLVSMRNAILPRRRDLRLLARK